MTSSLISAPVLQAVLMVAMAVVFARVAPFPHRPHARPIRVRARHTPSAKS